MAAQSVKREETRMKSNTKGLKKPKQQIKTGTVILTSCMVEALSELDSIFRQRFLHRLGKAYKDVSDSVPVNKDCLEMLTCAHEILGVENKRLREEEQLTT
jgi:hypothetical protein